MAATFNWCEDNGAATGSPNHGTTQSGFGADTHYATDVNWKSTDDCTANSGTAYSAAPIVAGQNSYIKDQYGKFTTPFNEILNCKWSARTSPAGALATGITLVGAVVSAYGGPSTTAMGGSPTNYTSAPVAIGSGTSVNFSTSGPEDASPTSTLSASGYTQYLTTQIQTTTSAAAGDMATITTTLQYDEN